MPVWIQAADEAVLLFLQSIRLSFLDPLVLCYTHLGDAGVLWIVLSVFLLCHPKTRRAGTLALCAMALGLLCNNVLLKGLVQRPRPWLVVAGLEPLMAPPDPNSFPSGHTCAAFAAALSWKRGLPWQRAGWIGVAMAVLMGLSRLYVGVHFPTDVLAGALMGTLCAWVVGQVDAIREKRE